MFSWLIPPFKSLVPLVFTNTCFFSPHTFLLHYSDFGRDTTRRWGSWEGWLLPWLWCDWSTKGPWDFLIPSWIQWWKFTIFNPKAIKVKEIQPFRGAAPFQYQYEWQWFLMPHFNVASPRLNRIKFVAIHRYMFFLVIFFVALRRWSLTWCEFCHFAFLYSISLPSHFVFNDISDGYSFVWTHGRSYGKFC